jgi:hypothetical protein
MQHPIVQDDVHDKYEFKAFSVVNITFGLLDGALNAFPRGGLLYECGRFNKEQRIHYVQSIDAYEERNIKDMVKNFYEAMKL